MKVKYTHDKQRRTVTVEEARVYLSDESTHYGGGSDDYNHPRLTLRVRGAITAIVELLYQRHILSTGNGAAPEADVCWAKTSGHWSGSYGGGVELSHDVRKVGISDRPFRLSHEDTMRVAVARHLARLDSARGHRIYALRQAGPHTSSGNRSTIEIERDELERHVAVLREAGVPVIAMAPDASQRLQRIELPQHARYIAVEGREAELEVY